MSAFDILIESYTSTTGIYWPLTDNAGTTTATDASGNGNGLTMTSTTFGEPGLVPSDSETSALFTGSSNGTSSYQPSSTYVTAGLICNFSVLPSSFTWALINYDFGNHGLILGINNNSSQLFPYFFCANGSSNAQPISSTVIASGHNILLVGVWDGTNVILYQCDLTTGSSLVNTSLGLSGGTWSTASTWKTVGGGDNTATVYMGRAFVLPVALTPTQVAGLRTAALVSIVNNQGLIPSLI